MARILQLGLAPGLTGTKTENLTKTRGEGGGALGPRLKLVLEMGLGLRPVAMGLGLESVLQVPVTVLNPGGPIHNSGQWNLGPGAPPQSGHNPVPRLPVPGPVTHWAQDPGFPVSWLPI